LKVEVLHPAGVLFSGESASVSLPAIDGLMGILDGHAPMVVALGNGKIEMEGAAPDIDIEGGFAQVENSHLIVLAEKASSVT